MLSHSGLFVKKLFLPKSTLILMHELLLCFEKAGRIYKFKMVFNFIFLNIIFILNRTAKLFLRMVL